MVNEPKLPWTKLLDTLQDGLLEADRLDLKIVAARLTEIVEHLREGTASD